MATHMPDFDKGLLARLADTRAELLEARHMPGYLYTSPDIFQAEIDKIFMKEWLCVAD